ncbi:MAG: serine hydrolase [Lewinellaceae bacterium]|nr:serine hydrolase [Lewinellaceae bacterium]
MRKSMLTILVALLLAGFHLSAQPSEQVFREIDEFVEQARQDWKVPGVAVGIVKGNEVIYAKGFGSRDVESGKPVTENTLFAIGSSTKAMTALSVLQLVDDGLVEPDKPVLDYLPDFRMYDDYVTQHLSVRDLLCHRSGLPRHDLVWYGSDDSREELFHKLKYLEPNRGFREVFQYQNLMYMTAGYLVGEVTHSSWETQVKERIFKPLEMERASFSVENLQKDPDHALPYNKEKDEIKRMDFRNIDAVGPAGSVNASASEMCHWLIAQLNGGKYRDTEIITSTSLAESHTPVIPVSGPLSGFLAFDNNGGPITYGLGWFISTHKGRLAFQHGGNIDGFSAMVAFLPGDSIGIVVLTNLNGTMLPAVIRNFVFDKMLGEEIRDWNGEMLSMISKMEEQPPQEDVKRVSGTQPSHKLEAYTGQFTHPAYGTITITPEGDSLHLSYHTFEVNLGHYHYDVFTGKNPMIGEIKVAFHTNMDGEVARLSSILEPALDAIYFDRKAEEKAFTEEELSAFTGEYLIMGVQKLTVSEKDGQLQITVPGQPTYTLEYYKGLEFRLKGLKGYSALFQKGDDGKVTGLVMIQPNGQFKGEKVK